MFFISNSLENDGSPLKLSQKGNLFNWTLNLLQINFGYFDMRYVFNQISFLPFQSRQKNFFAPFEYLSEKRYFKGRNFRDLGPFFAKVSA